MKMTERECHLLAFRHQDTPWVPSPATGQDTCIPTVIEEGARGYGVTTDWFGVKYLYTAYAIAAITVTAPTIARNFTRKPPDLHSLSFINLSPPDPIF